MTRTRPDADTVDIGLLLAGGSARRAGVDKRYLVLEGRTLLQRNLAFLRALFPTVAISLGQGQDVDLGDAGPAELIRDVWPGSSPLAGIASALARFGRPLFVMAVDLAIPDRDAAQRVLVAAQGHDVALPTVGRHHEPLFAAYGPACLAPMESLLDAGRHRIVEILPQLDVAPVPFPDDSFFRNINTMSEYREAREALRRMAEQRSADKAEPGVDGPADEKEPASGGGSVDDGGWAGGASAPPALVAVVGKSDSGKTTFIEKLLPELLKLGLRVGTVKHDAHRFDIDHPGKDSWRHGRAGALAYVISSPERLAYVSKLDKELPLPTIARRFFAGFDLVVAEGYKRSAPHCVELFRRSAGHEEPLCGPGEALALVTDAPFEHEHRFALDDAAGLARFLASRLETLRRY